MANATTVVEAKARVYRELGAHNICVNTLAPLLNETGDAYANSHRKAAARDPSCGELKRDGYLAHLLGAPLLGRQG